VQYTIKGFDNMDMSNLIEKVKSNLILNIDKDDELIKEFIRASVSYAESYQKNLFL